jgi:hypothetical protein
MIVIFYRFGSFWVEPTFQCPHGSKNFLIQLITFIFSLFCWFSVNFILSTPVGSSIVSSSTDAVKDLKFVYYLLSDLYNKTNLRIVVMTDNIEAIFMLENASISFQTWYVDTRYQFVCEFI